MKCLRQPSALASVFLLVACRASSRDVEIGSRDSGERSNSWDISGLSDLCQWVMGRRRGGAAGRPCVYRIAGIVGIIGGAQKQWDDFGRESEGEPSGSPGRAGRPDLVSYTTRG